MRKDDMFVEQYSTSIGDEINDHHFDIVAEGSSLFGTLYDFV